MPEELRSTATVETQDEISLRLEAERRRLREAAGLVQLNHCRKPVDRRAFKAEERERVTILFGGLTWKHEKLIQSVFQGTGYKCVMVPTPDVNAFQLGKSSATTASAIPRTSLSATWCRTGKASKSRACRAKTS